MVVYPFGGVFVRMYACMFVYLYLNGSNTGKALCLEYCVDICWYWMVLGYLLDWISFVFWRFFGLLDLY